MIFRPLSYEPAGTPFAGELRGQRYQNQKAHAALKVKPGTCRTLHVKNNMPLYHFIEVKSENYKTIKQSPRQ